MQDQPEDAIDRPDPKTNGYVDMRYKNGEVSKIEFDVDYFVDDWFTMSFTFSVEGKTARLMWLEPPGDHYNPRQSEPARHEAIRQVTELPGIEYVEMDPSYE